ncbi:hypothetical protein [Bdellovibrio sp. NC01]|uniref:hypothetical protein n=1 Tax=Bdellovibrio sp. NC01 TaxID=2220073 RepID=UPI0011597D22|nr:hypothetical protein [Bdellovibrio sp. NC01]QDK37975.1 hypothetical protein DOE51_10430 [Bdellovibrio sp. NC01]
MKKVFAALVILTIPLIAKADMVWPALLFADRYALIAIPVGLLLEFFILKKYLPYSSMKSFWITFFMNLASTIIGGILIALAGLVWEVGPGILLYSYLSVGTFNPWTWIFTFVSAIAITTYIEYTFVRITTKLKKKELIKPLLLANLVSVAIAFVSLIFFPIQL